MDTSQDIASTLNRVGRQLQEQYGAEPIPVAVLTDEVVKQCGCRPSSVLPADRCYNRTNDGIRLDNSPIFIHEERGLFRYVGLNYAYTGPLYHKPKRQVEPERIVGQWTDGRLEYTG